MTAVMKLTLTTEDEDVFELEVNGELEVETLEALCEIETGISSNEFNLIHKGRFLTDGKKRLEEMGIKDGDSILIYRVSPEGAQCTVQSEDVAAAASAPTVSIDGAETGLNAAADAAGTSAEFSSLPEDQRRRLIKEATALREALLSRPEEIAVLRGKNPTLAEALVTGDAVSFASVLHYMRCQQQKQQEDQQQNQQLPERNLLDPRMQEAIAEEIRRKNVESNRAAAAEFTPEMFAKVTMLFVPVKVNGHLVKAFVDTGAQTTLINVPCAKRCDLMHLLDRSYAGVAYGVGTQRIIGRVHVANLQIGPKDFLPSSFNVVENEPLEMLLGLDTLKRHRCVIDLDRNSLLVGSSGNSVPFLEGADMPDISCVAKKDEEPDQTLKDEEEPSSSSEGGFIGGGGGFGGGDDLVASLAQAFRQMQTEAESTERTARVDEAEVEKLEQMGFERTLAREELIRQRGDVNQTIAALLAKSLSFG